MEDEIRKRLDRIERLLVAVVMYASTALIFALLLPQADDIQKLTGISPKLNSIVLAMVAGGVGGILTRMVMTRNGRSI